MVKKQIGRKVEGWKAKSWFKVYVPEIFGFCLTLPLRLNI
jgi:ribosomal protein S3AE